jgi:HEPN domain-containing protein
LLRHPEELIPRHACWLAQQAAEKALTALLIRAQVDFPRTHDLDRLWQLLPTASQSGVGAVALSELSEWAVESRHPGNWPDAQPGDARRAVESARLPCDQAQMLLPSRETTG